MKIGDIFLKWGKRVIAWFVSTQQFFIALGLAWVGLELAGCAAQNQPSMLNPQGPEATQVARLSIFMFVVAAVVFAVVLILLLVALLHRKQGGFEPVLSQPGDRRRLTLVILGGAVAPALVLMLVMGFSISIEQVFAANPPPAVVVNVIGHQWWWEVIYPDQGFKTANEIHIPVGKPVQVKVTTADVIHSFWVPQLHSKIDMIPGQTNTITLQADQPGTYKGECAEYCGTQHARMDFIVVAESPQDFFNWEKQQSQPPVDPAPGTPQKEGQQAFLGSACVYCHTIQGTNASGIIGPDLTHLASRSTLGAGVIPNADAYLAGWILNSQAIKPGNKMPPMNLDPVQLQAILSYLDTLK